MKPTLVLAVALAASTSAFPADQPQWGEQFTRNMLSAETGLPSDLDLATGRNVKWTVPLGDNAYGSTIVAGGKVLIGANNATPRDPRIEGDHGILLCLNESDGALDWQLAVPRTGGDDYLDWPDIAMCSAPTVEDRRVYTVTNRFEVVCLDLDGQHNGNGGPYQDEAIHMAQDGAPPVEVTERDADILWLFSLTEGAGIYPHDGAHMSILIDGRYLYLNSGNGVDNTHKVVRKPDAPCLVVLDKESGKLVTRDEEHMGPRIMHATWSPPSLGTVNGQRMIAFGGPDGVCYAFKALTQDLEPGRVRPLERIWRFDCDPAAPKDSPANYLNNRKVSPSVIESMPVFLGNRIYVTVGGDVWWGKEQSWLKCIDASKQGDITEGGELWSYPIPSHCCSTPAVASGLVFVGDGKGIVHCVDSNTGKPYWTHDLSGEIWGSALAADGKVYIGTRGKQFCILATSKEKQVLSTTSLDAPIASTPTAANGVLYVNTLRTLYALSL